VALGLIVLMALGAAARAQQGILPGVNARKAGPPTARQPGGDTLSPAEGPLVFAKAARTQVQLLALARQLVERGRYAEAVRALGAILDSPEDNFLPERSGPVHRSLKSEAQQMLGGMPAAGAELYELQFGARARQMLDEAVAGGSVSGLTEVSRRFFHTQAGYEATFLLGLDHLDHGQALAGALVLKRLRDQCRVAEQFEPALSLALATCWLRAGSPKEARETLSALRARHPDARIQIGGKEAPLLASDDAAVAWLSNMVAAAATAQMLGVDRWAMVRGNPARNAIAAGGEPLLSMRWRVPTSDHPYIEAMLQELHHDQEEQEQWMLPGVHPLVVNDLVLMRTTRNLLAVDFNSGKRIWEAPPAEDPFEAMLNSSPLQDPQGYNGPGGYRPEQQIEQGLRARMFGDATYGTLSSDGQCVFAVEDLQLETANGGRNMFFTGQHRNEQAGPRAYNRLAAYDIRTGRLQWHLGGSPEEFNLPLAGTFFLGPPLPLMDQLFVLGESRDEIRLIALDGKTGNALWTQQLADVDRNILNDPSRRLAGVAPSYADGILVCPTGNKSIVALEAATRSLLWGYTYNADNDPSQQQAMFFAMQGVPVVSASLRFTDSSAVIADGYVLATPVDSNEVHCLKLADGTLCWTEPRQDDLYLACVHQQTVVLVGRQGVRALRLAPPSKEEAQRAKSEAKVHKPDAGQAEFALENRGESREDAVRPLAAWGGRKVAYPPGAAPAGTGFQSGDLYYVPLTNGEVIGIDLGEGRIVSTAKGRGTMPGNLVCYKGKIVSQRADAVEVYYQLVALRKLVDRRLATWPDDPEALSLRGEILWHEGNLAEAIRCFRRSLDLAGNPSTRALLRESLLDGLRVDFARLRSHAGEIPPLCDEPAQQATYLCLMASGLQGAGEFHAALEQYERLVALDREHRGMETIDKSLSVRRDRWLQVQLANLREAAPPAMQAELDRYVASCWQEAQKSGTAQAIRRFLDYFAGQPLGTEAREAMIHKYCQSGNFLSAEILLSEEEQSGDPRRMAAATVEMADLLRQAGRPQDAAIYYRRLAGVVGADGKTGKPWLDSLPADDPVRPLLAAASPWPVGNVLVEKVPPKRPPTPTGNNQSSIEFQGDRSPFFLETTVDLQQAPPQLVGRDGYGNVLWHLSLMEIARENRFSLNQSAMRVQAQGHLLLLSVGDRVLAIDTLCKAGGSARVLWSQDLDEPRTDLARSAQLRILLANQPAAVQQFRMANGEPAISLPEAVSGQMLCLRRSHTCLGLDPATGQTIWTRQDIRPESTLFGDQDYIFVAPLNDSKTLVLRARDGTTAGVREVRSARFATLGRNVLAWHAEGDRATLEMIDAWTGKAVWPERRFAASAQLALADREAIGIFEPGGRFLLIALPNGATITDTTLLPEPGLTRITLLRSPDQFLLITQSGEGEDDAQRQVQAMPGTNGERVQRVTKGRVYGFDRQGKSLWPKPVKIDDQFLLLDQPSRLPVLVFAAMINQRVQQRMENTTALLAIDRRNGRVVLNERSHATTHFFTIVGDPEKNKTVDMQLLNRTVRLTFTDQPLPAATSRAKTTTATKALFNALRRAAFGRSSDDDDDDPEPAVPVPATPPTPRALPPAPAK
jgi:outer membrane protein assembly factor BamB/tetratricopeptide (TPR) repeat protein